MDPSGSYFAWKASAIGKNMTNAKTFLEKRYSDEMELEARRKVSLNPIVAAQHGSCRLRWYLHLAVPRLPHCVIIDTGAPSILFRFPCAFPVRPPGRLRFRVRQDAVHTAILTLKEGLEGQITGNNIEIGVVAEDGKFRVLTPAEVADYLSEVE